MLPFSKDVVYNSNLSAPKKCSPNLALQFSSVLKRSKDFFNFLELIKPKFSLTSKSYPNKCTLVPNCAFSSGLNNSIWVWSLLELHNTIPSEF